MTLEELRRHGFGVAYRMLGSVTDAEDVVQEALLRFARQERPPDEPAAWLTTVTTRLAIDHLRLARVRRETYPGPWLPEPIVEDDGGARVSAARRPILGAAKIARFMAGTARLRRKIGPFDQRLARVNGQPGRVLTAPDGSPWDVLSIDVAGDRIQTVLIMRNPDKLRHVAG